MRAIIAGLLCVLVLGCSDSETPLPIEPEIVYPPVPLGQPPAAEFFAPFKDTLTDEEFEHLLKHTAEFCEGDHLDVSVLRYRLRWGLSDESVARVFSRDDSIELKQAAHLSVKHRIRVAAWFKYQRFNPYEPNYLKEIHFELDYVIYQFSEAFGIYTMHGNELGRGWSGYTNITDDCIYDKASHRGFSNLPDTIVPVEAKEAYEHIHDNWMYKGKIDISQITDYGLVSWFLVVFDSEGEPVIPIPKSGDNVVDVVVHIEKAPKASDAEIALYNRIYTPNSYDCVEDD